jgi:hypothetical protein
MNRLAIETSTEQLSVAVMARGQVWSHQGPGGAQASAGLLAAVHAVVAQAGLALNDMGVILLGDADSGAMLVPDVPSSGKKSLHDEFRSFVQLR